jgi:hypothetical protein
MDWTARVQSPTEAEDSSSNLCIQIGSGAHPASYTMGTRALSPGVKCGQGMMLTIHDHLMARLRKSRSYTSSHPKEPLWSIPGPLYLLCKNIFTIMVNEQVELNCIN